MLEKENDLISKSTIDEKMIKDFLFTSETKLSDKQQQMFMQIAIRHNLDPFKREVYAIAYGNEFSIVTGYQVYIERAEVTGNLNGWTCVNTDEGAKITIYRKDWEHPFEWEVTYEEFDKGQSSWKKMRRFMIKKVCIGQGFRLAFPEALGGMPYLKEEMEGATPFNAKLKVEKKSSVNKAEKKSTSSSTTSTTSTNQASDGQASNEKGGEVMVKVKNVTKKTGSDSTGKKWTKYTIHTPGGSAYSTFDKKIAEAAEKIKDADHEACIMFETFASQGVDYLNICENGFVVT